VDVGGVVPLIARGTLRSARLPKSLQPPERERDVQASTCVAIKPVPEQGLGALEAVGDRSIGKVQPAGGLAAVLTRVEEDLEGLDQLVAHPRIGEERSQLALDHRRRQLRVTQQESLDAKLGQIIDDAASTDPVRDTKALLELEQ
jgi:hypothetical protein